MLVENVEGLIDEPALRKAYTDIVSFERALADDRYLIVKFFLHISKEEQQKRFERLENDPDSSWQVDPEDWEHHNKYADYLVATEKMLEHTESDCAPWTLIEATDRRWARIKIFHTLIRRMEKGLKNHGCDIPEDGDES